MKPFDSKWERVAPVALGAMFGVCIALLVVSIVLFKRAADRGETGPWGRSRAPALTAGQERSAAIIEATRRVSPAVVSVRAFGSRDVSFNPYLYWQWLQQSYFNRELQGAGSGGRPMMDYMSYGSGIVLSPDGYILTNEHVIRGAGRVTVTMNDGTEAQATVIGSAQSYDLALLKIEAKALLYAPLGDSDELSTGEWVIAIGNPFGYTLNDWQPTVTVGVVSAVHRDVQGSAGTGAKLNNMIQTDAAINPGNSGGPLVSSRGEVVGINTFVFSSQEGSIPGMSFAIPINTAKMVIDEIREHGRVRGTWTGITVQPLDPEEARRRGIGIDYGLLVERVEPGEPGDAAGVRRGDVIVEVNGMKVRTQDQAARAIFGLRVGDETEILVFRGGERMTLRLRLAEYRQGA